MHSISKYSVYNNSHQTLWQNSVVSSLLIVLIGVCKICDFRPVLCFFLERIQDRNVVTVEY